MDEAVGLASREARPGDAVLLSPGCASFDWYQSYAQRGDDFARAVAELPIGGPS
jgi:UDP-N-acetylmuramoylalanine--D-glutamate ligase